jgi:hypothetical protein
VITDTGKGAQIDFLKAEAVNGPQGGTQVLVAEADGRAA